MFIIFVVKRKKILFGGYAKQITKIMPGEFRGILVAFVHVANTRFDGLVWGIFVNKESTAKLAIYKLASC